MIMTLNHVAPVSFLLFSTILMAPLCRRKGQVVATLTKQSFLKLPQSSGAFGVSHFPLGTLKVVSVRTQPFELGTLTVCVFHPPLPQGEMPSV